MFKKITATATAIAILYAPAIMAAETTDAIAHSAACYVYANEAGLDKDAKEWGEFNSAINERSGLTEFLRGYWTGVGAATATALIATIGTDRQARISLFVKFCLPEGQPS